MISIKPIVQMTAELGKIQMMGKPPMESGALVKFLQEVSKDRCSRAKFYRAVPTGKSFAATESPIFKRAARSKPNSERAFSCGATRYAMVHPK